MKIGLDLGTSKMVAAQVIDGRPRLQHFAGQRYLPCYLNKEKAAWYFGEEARRREEVFPGDTAHSCLLHLFDDKFKWPLAGEKYSAADLLAKLLEHLKLEVERDAGEKISGAVVAVPNAFNTAERERCQRCLQKAAIPLDRFISATTASALYLQYLTKKTGELVAIIDLGAGAFNAGLYRLNSDSEIGTLARGGHFGAGGRRIDEKLETFLLSKAGFRGRLTSDGRAALLQQINLAKPYLASMASYPIKLPKLSNPVLSRSEYERVTQEVVRELHASLDEVLRHAGIRLEEIGPVLLLGGLANVKVVRDYVQERFRKAPLTHYQDKEPVACGAALESLKKAATEMLDPPAAAVVRIVHTTSASKPGVPSAAPALKSPRRKEPAILAFLSILLLAALVTVFLVEKQGAFQAAAITVEMPADSTAANGSPALQAFEMAPAPLASPGVEIGFQTNGRFGLKTTTGDPDRSDDDEKKLTYNVGGGTSNTRIYIDGKTPIFGSGDGNYTEVPALTGSQTLEYIDKQAQTDADIVFLIDLSGSMQEEIVSLINSCERFADELVQSAVSYRLGVVTFHDFVTGAYGPQGELTDDVQVFKQWLAPLPNQLTGGEEVPYKAMAHALSYFQFRTSAKKVLVLMTDEGSSDARSSNSGITLTEIQNQVRAANAILFPIVASNYSSEYTPMLGTEGKLFEITDNFVSIITELSKRLSTPIKTTTKPLKFVWQYENVAVTQELAIVPNEMSGRQEMIKITYTLANNDNAPHEIGLRIMLDTFIGANDGVPFAIPGQGNLIDKAIELTDREIPNFIQALEHEDLRQPGVMANVIFRGGEATPPQRVVISGWNDPDMPWEYLAAVGGLGHPLLRGGSGNIKDSAIGIYYGPWNFYPYTSRTIVAYYGLGSISSTKTQQSRLGVIVPMLTLFDRDEFQVVALISEPKPNVEVTIKLPAELKLANSNETFRKSVPAPSSQRRQSQVAWFLRIAPNAQGVLPIQVELSPDGILETANVYVRKKITQ